MKTTIFKLRVKNFKTFGNNVREFCFKDAGLISLRGRNGAGKSSVIQALAIALGVDLKYIGIKNILEVFNYSANPEDILQICLTLKLHRRGEEEETSFAQIEYEAHQKKEIGGTLHERRKSTTRANTTVVIKRRLNGKIVTLKELHVFNKSIGLHVEYPLFIIFQKLITEYLENTNETISRSIECISGVQEVKLSIEQMKKSEQSWLEQRNETLKTLESLRDRASSLNERVTASEHYFSLIEEMKSLKMKIQEAEDELRAEKVKALESKKEKLENEMKVLEGIVSECEQKLKENEKNSSAFLKGKDSGAVDNENEIVDVCADLEFALSAFESAKKEFGVCSDNVAKSELELENLEVEAEKKQLKLNQLVHIELPAIQNLAKAVLNFSRSSSKANEENFLSNLRNADAKVSQDRKKYELLCKGDGLDSLEKQLKMMSVDKTKQKSNLLKQLQALDDEKDELDLEISQLQLERNKLTWECSSSALKVISMYYRNRNQKYSGKGSSLPCLLDDTFCYNEKAESFIKGLLPIVTFSEEIILVQKSSEVHELISLIRQTESFYCKLWIVERLDHFDSSLVKTKSKESVDYICPLLLINSLQSGSFAPHIRLFGQHIIVRNEKSAFRLMETGFKGKCVSNDTGNVHSCTFVAGGKKYKSEVLEKKIQADKAFQAIEALKEQLIELKGKRQVMEENIRQIELGSSDNAVRLKNLEFKSQILKSAFHISNNPSSMKDTITEGRAFFEESIKETAESITLISDQLEEYNFLQPRKRETCNSYRRKMEDKSGELNRLQQQVEHLEHKKEVLQFSIDKANNVRTEMIAKANEWLKDKCVVKEKLTKAKSELASVKTKKCKTEKMIGLFVKNAIIAENFGDLKGLFEAYKELRRRECQINGKIKALQSKRDISEDDNWTRSHLIGMKEELHSIEESISSLSAKEREFENTINEIKAGVESSKEIVSNIFQATFQSAVKETNSTFQILFPSKQISCTKGTEEVNLSVSEIFSHQNSSSDSLKNEADATSAIEYPLESLSGGQKTILSLSFILALCKLAGHPFLILDESDEALDQEKCFLFYQMLTNNFSDMQTIFISHRIMATEEKLSSNINMQKMVIEA
eukprot:Nk52_evm60s239 gene=Nk52_evmTU60s239